jgi:glycerol-3-phosphate acyltransferase PlsY
VEWLSLLGAYLLGGVPIGFLLVKWKTGQDVRAQGSGNIGATNVHRAAGRVAGIVTLILDAAKGYLAVWLAYRFSGGSMAWASAAAVCVMLGHIFTPFLRLKGGKGVATFLGAFLFLAPGAAVAVTLVFLVALAALHMISLGAILGGITFPLAVWLISQPGWPLMSASVVCCLLVLWRHKENAQRIHDGTERVFAWNGKRA